MIPSLSGQLKTKGPGRDRTSLTNKQWQVLVSRGEERKGDVTVNSDDTVGLSQPGPRMCSISSRFHSVHMVKPVATGDLYTESLSFSAHLTEYSLVLSPVTWITSQRWLQCQVVGERGLV